MVNGETINLRENFGSGAGNNVVSVVGNNVRCLLDTSTFTSASAGGNWRKG